MRMLVMIESCILALATCTAFAQGSSAPPTRVRQTGVYACPTHPQIQATWPAQCPICQTVLNQVQPSAPTRIGTIPVADEEDRDRTRRNEELREQARRNEELRERSRNYGYVYPPGGTTYVYPPQGYTYQYPANGYYYDPSTGYYYNPSTRYYYYYNPNSGYYYAPNYGYYYYNPPGYYYYPNNRYYRPNEERREREERKEGARR